MRRARLDTVRAHGRCSYPLGLFLRGDTLGAGPTVPQPPERNRAASRPAV